MMVIFRAMLLVAFLSGTCLAGETPEPKSEKEKISYTLQAAPADTGTDADAIYNALRGIPTGLISVPNRYMHSPNEMVALADLERAARLCAAFARRLDPAMDFIPR